MAEKIPEYEIRLMKRDEIPQAISLGLEESDFFMGSHSLDTWYDYDPEAFYVAVTKSEQIIGTCAGIILEPDFAFICLYRVKSTYRCRGIGKQIWAKVMERVGDKNIAILPAPEMLKTYREKAGFSYQCDSQIIIYETEKVSTENLMENVHGINTMMINPEDSKKINAVAQYECKIFGFSRKTITPILCNQKESVMIAAFTTSDNSVCGYGLVCKTVRGNEVFLGPLVADNTEVAEVILYNLVKAFPVGERVTIYAIDSNESVAVLMNKLDFKKKLELAKLYKMNENFPSASFFKEEHIKFRKVFAACSFSKYLF